MQKCARNSLALKEFESRHVDMTIKGCHRFDDDSVWACLTTRGVVELFEHAWTCRIYGVCNGIRGMECMELESGYDT